MRNGLLEPPAGAPTVPADESPVAQAQDQLGGLAGGEATEQEQAQYNVIMDAAFEAIHGERTRDGTLKQLQQAPKERLGQIIGELALTVYTVIEQRIEEQGRQISDSVKFEVAEDIVMEFVQVAVAAGIMGDDEQTMDTVIGQALDFMIAGYGKRLKDSGQIRPEQLASLTEAINQSAAMSGAPQPNNMTAAIRSAAAQPPTA